MQREKSDKKLQHIISLDHSLTKSLDLRRATMLKSDQKRAESLLEARSANALASTLRREQNKLRMLDFRENYEAEREVKQVKRDRIVSKHEKIG